MKRFLEWKCDIGFEGRRVWWRSIVTVLPYTLWFGRTPSSKWIQKSIQKNGFSATKGLLFLFYKILFYITPRVKSAGYLEICHCIVLEIYVKQMKKRRNRFKFFHAKASVIPPKGFHDTRKRRFHSLWDFSLKQTIKEKRI